MRHILAALILGASLAGASAAFASEDANGFPREDKTYAIPAVGAQSDTQIVVPAGPSQVMPWYTELRFENLDDGGNR